MYLNAVTPSILIHILSFLYYSWGNGKKLNFLNDTLQFLWKLPSSAEYCGCQFHAGLAVACQHSNGFPAQPWDLTNILFNLHRSVENTNSWTNTTVKNEPTVMSLLMAEPSCFIRGNYFLLVFACHELYCYAEVSDINITDGSLPAAESGALAGSAV